MVTHKSRKFVKPPYSGPKILKKMADFCGFAAVFCVEKRRFFAPTRPKTMFLREFLFGFNLFCACVELYVRGIIFFQEGKFVGGIEYFVFYADFGGRRIRGGVCVGRCVCRGL